MNDATGLREAILQQPEMLEDLRVVAELGLPQGCIAAGYVRNFAWDVLHGYTHRTPLHDMDVLYYDPECLDETAEKQYEAALIARSPLRNWSVKNQARMHLRNGEKVPYRSVADAMRYWPETATAVGVRLHTAVDIELLTPLGLDDLLSLKVRQSPYFRDSVAFRQRMIAKEWMRLWPRLQLIEE
ncbi:nucleotidyltransferase family protein [Paenibacillus macerans]|uniref:nucleotidyltransferase family protein n=1 Tax=Paenibacillus macerans TaxID=44252 RepID=UPI00203FB248|nr:nucleotidyltransferase family protein [Paenibacillus macerans]MCM3698991.1 nucleotidyltransferase family protein [Paenibacillus macerans]